MIVSTTLTYDNSADNPRNPSSPPVHVRWGEGSTDEMGSIGLGYVAVNEADLAGFQGRRDVFSGGDDIGRAGEGEPDGAGLRGQAAGGGLGLNLDPAQIAQQLAR